MYRVVGSSVLRVGGRLAADFAAPQDAAPEAGRGVGEGVVEASEALDR